MENFKTNCNETSSVDLKRFHFYSNESVTNSRIRNAARIRRFRPFIAFPLPPTVSSTILSKRETNIARTKFPRLIFLRRRRICSIRPAFTKMIGNYKK